MFHRSEVRLNTRPSAVIFGAGNVGRGFLGQLFTESDYEVTFVDIDEPLLAALNKHRGYRLHLVDNESRRELWISPVRALHAGDTDQVAEAVAQASLMATSAGVRALPAVAKTVAAGLARRLARPDPEPLNIIICENLKGAADYFGGLVREALPERKHDAFGRWVGLVETVIGRMVPLLTPEQRAADPSLIIAEPYKELPIDRRRVVGPVPNVVGLEPCDHFEAYVARKLYIHNGGHAVLAYLGYLRGHVYGYEALEDPVVRPLLEAAWVEAREGIAAAYQVSARWLDDHAGDLRRRFANRDLGDTLARLGRDPLRKLAPEDRLVGAARLAEKAGHTPTALAWAIAAGYRFADPDDSIATRLQEQLTAQGLPVTLQAVSGIDPAEPLGQAVVSCYRRLERGEWP